MAAATVESQKVYDLGPFLMTESICTTMTVDTEVLLTHGGPQGEVPLAVYLTSSSAAITDNGVILTRIPSSDVVADGKVAFVPHTEDGGALTAGTKAYVYCLFRSRQDQEGASFGYTGT